jgi:hypothetical protein
LTSKQIESPFAILKRARRENWEGERKEMKKYIDKI